MQLLVERLRSYDPPHNAIEILSLGGYVFIGVSWLVS